MDEIILALILAVFTALIYTPIYFIIRWKDTDVPFLRHLAIYAFMTTALVVGFATILISGTNLTFNPGFHMLNLTPFIWLHEEYLMGAYEMKKQLILNIGMFIPLGLLLPIIFKKLRRFWKTALCALFITLFIEVFQYFIGRSADIDDLIMNEFGGMIGYGMFALFHNACSGQGWWNKLTGSNRHTESSSYTS